MPGRDVKLVCITLAVCLGGPLAWGAVRPHVKPAAAGTKPALHIEGSVRTALDPGRAAPLRLTLVNRRRSTLTVTRVRIRAGVDAPHRRAGCTRRDYAVRAVPKRALPLRIPSGGMRFLRTRVRMRNLPRNQDACKGAQLKLRYVGRTR